MHRGQATLEYVALLAVLAVMLTAGLAFSGALPPLARSLSDAIRHGICLVSGSICTPREAAAAGLDPCPLFRLGRDEKATTSVAIVSLQRGDAMAIEHLSDGTATVSFMDGGGLGVTGGIGLRLSPLGVHASLSGTAGARFTGGRTWKFPTVAAAEAFVRRFASGQTLGGEIREVGHDICFLCPGWLRGRGRPDLPPPASRSIQGGAFGEAAATLDIPIGGRLIPSVSAGPSMDAVLGRQTEGARTTWYLRVDSSMLLHLGPVLSSVGGARTAASVLELTTAHGRPLTLRVRAASAASDDPGLSAATVTGDELAEGVRRAVSGPARADGRALETDVALDLRDPVNLAAVRAFLGGGPPLPSEIAALGRRLATDSAVDVRMFDYDPSGVDVSAEGALGVRFGAGYQRTVEVRHLLGAWSRRPGDRLRAREDCTSPTTA